MIQVRPGGEASAARNADRILRTARAVFAELGPDALLEEIARRADVRIRTPYNHFPNKADLVRAALDQAIAEDLAPPPNKHSPTTTRYTDSSAWSRPR